MVGVELGTEGCWLMSELQVVIEGIYLDVDVHALWLIENTHLHSNHPIT
jgi:hypothetical protein